MESSQENSADLVSLGASIWNDRKDELSTATVSEARRVAADEIHIR